MYKNAIFSLLGVVFIGLPLGYEFRNFDWEGIIGTGPGNVLIVFLIVTYVPLAFLVWKKKPWRNKANGSP